jgi:hypothetical protein
VSELDKGESDRLLARTVVVSLCLDNEGRLGKSGKGVHGEVGL